MTFSIVACDLAEQTWGVAVASKFPAVGAVVPWAQAGIGAVATQSYANTSFGPRGLALMTTGLSADQTLARLLEDDPERDLRQVGLIDAQGRAATYSGSGCHVWAGGITGDGFAVQGNILVGERVVKALAKAFLASKGDLPSRLHAALLAGDRAGGDRRGRQSAALYAVKAKGGYGGYNDRWLDYRVDDHEDPVPRLGELIEMHRLYFEKSNEADRLVLKGRQLVRLQAILQKLSYLSAEPSGKYDEDTRGAFRAMLGNENFEERADPSAGWVDKPVLDFLFKKFEK
ncbi:MAG TPA: DUF1028 domain-containing protein [Anaerolineales bacterium]